MVKTNILLTSFNRYPQQTCTLYRPERYRELLNLKKPLIARGNGYSYGDAALNHNGHIITTTRLNRFLSFDKETGIITAEAGVTLQEILNIAIPAGWFLPVIPGTQYATLGGCIAADVHGKNHAIQGSFGNHIQWLELITANGEIIRCSQDQHHEIFWATVGGLGLTGIIGLASLKLIPITSSYFDVTYQPTQNLSTAIDELTRVDDYSVAWLDVNSNPVRGIMMTAKLLPRSELPHKFANNPLAFSQQRFKLNFPWQCCSALLNKHTLKLYQNFYYFKKRKIKSSQCVSYENYLFPLDHISHWNRLYGKTGFIQYQCSLSAPNAIQGFTELLTYLNTKNVIVYLAVLKKLGVANPAPLSFSSSGFTLALDIPINQQLFGILNQLDEIILRYEGKIYLAKDARLSPQNFRAMYPRFTDWLKIKNQIDPEHVFSSSLSRRLEIC